MKKLIQVFENANFEIISIDPNQDPQFYLNKFPGSFFIDESEFPDMEYADCFVLSGKSIVIEKEKVKERKLNELRSKRKELFVELDREFIELLSQEKDLTEIKMKQQKARDLTESLKNLDPKDKDFLEKVSLF